ncbi:MAG TPA: Ig-like domain-containing protein, partial [Candidatus Kapabacteria bacterium]|nr:Ig-like domain-containing protein [Candidatus Kapabacteria bacterium]
MEKRHCEERSATEGSRTRRSNLPVRPTDCFVERISLRSIRSPRNDTKNNLVREYSIRNYLLFPLLPSYFILVLSSCASQQPPPGGPVDTTRPVVDSVMPHHRQINVPTNTKVWFRFARDVDQASFATAFTITPYLNGTPTFHWSGHNEVRVELPKLKDSTTYTVQLSR